MKREVIYTRHFSKELDNYFRKRQLLYTNFESFKKELTVNPELGDIIVGTGGVRKARLKSATKGKGGGFRVCYYDFVEKNRLYLIWIYPKNEQEI